MLDAKYEPTMYLSQWFMTVFALNFPFECIVRIWDIFMIEGRKTLYRVALAMFKINEKALLQQEVEGIFSCMRSFQENINPDQLIKVALSFKFSKKLIEKIEKEYLENPIQEIVSLCRMN